MTDRAQELDAAAAGIDEESLDSARKEMIASFREMLYWLGLFSSRLEAVRPEERHKFARALALILLGHLPTKPQSCPFCIQYGRNQGCQGCGYAATHGNCDSDQSSFSIFIESFSELGRAIYLDTEVDELSGATKEMRTDLDICIQRSCRLIKEMNEDLLNLSARELMERKARYLEQMIRALPLHLFGREVEEQHSRVLNALADYW